mmetsp:Transcript_57563/g.132768  ORF Transcript_57563/g.132768 Transcript_57563/m.132768 type:complete len:208 (+) Transcript_57563:3973-4596(+)
MGSIVGSPSVLRTIHRMDPVFGTQRSITGSTWQSFSISHNHKPKCKVSGSSCPLLTLDTLSRTSLGSQISINSDPSTNTRPSFSPWKVLLLPESGNSISILISPTNSPVFPKRTPSTWQGLPRAASLAACKRASVNWADAKVRTMSPDFCTKATVTPLLSEGYRSTWNSASLKCHPYSPCSAESGYRTISLLNHRGNNLLNHGALLR